MILISAEMEIEWTYNQNSPSAQIEGDSLCLPVFWQANGTLLAALYPNKLSLLSISPHSWPVLTIWGFESE